MTEFTVDHRDPERCTDDSAPTSADDGRIVLWQRSVEILNYFGSCPKCGYTAEAAMVVTTYSDGSTTSRPAGRCGLPCGWTGPIEITVMSGGYR